MVKIMLDSYVPQKSYIILKSKNVVKFHVHISLLLSHVASHICLHSYLGKDYVAAIISETDSNMCTLHINLAL